MDNILWVVFISLCTNSVQSYLYLPSHKSLKSCDRSRIPQGNDVGDPLFLTPYIERGDIAEAKQLARVHLTDLPQVVSYSGFLTANKTHDSHHFFWYFPSMENSETSPVLLWLQGGPGSSSLFGLFMENGPIQVVDIIFKLRDTHWALNHHLLYIDSPVGTGFSFTKNAYCTNEVQISEQLYSSVTQFFKLFPRLQKNEFFLTGESYAGKYIPALAYMIHKKNPTADIKINLQGLAIGDGWSDPEHMHVYSEYLYQIGLIDWNEKAIMKEKERITVNYIKKQDWNEATKASGEVLKPISRSMRYNYISGSENDAIGNYKEALESNVIRKAIHVGNLSYCVMSDKVFEILLEDQMQSVSRWISELLDHYPIFFYNGQLDIIVAYPLTVNFLRQLNFTGAEEYETAARHEWKVDGETAGYVKRAGRMTELLVRGAGHMVPMDQPYWAWDMITRITRRIPFYDNE